MGTPWGCANEFRLNLSYSLFQGSTMREAEWMAAHTPERRWRIGVYAGNTPVVAGEEFHRSRVSRVTIFVFLRCFIRMSLHLIIIRAFWVPKSRENGLLHLSFVIGDITKVLLSSVTTREISNKIWNSHLNIYLISITRLSRFSIIPFNKKIQDEWMVFFPNVYELFKWKNCSWRTVRRAAFSILEDQTKVIADDQLESSDLNFFWLPVLRYTISKL